MENHLVAGQTTCGGPLVSPGRRECGDALRAPAEVRATLTEPAGPVPARCPTTQGPRVSLRRRIPDQYTAISFTEAIIEAGIAPVGDRPGQRAYGIRHRAPTKRAHRPRPSPELDRTRRGRT